MTERILDALLVILWLVMAWVCLTRFIDLWQHDGNPGLIAAFALGVVLNLANAQEARADVRRAIETGRTRA